MKTVTLSSLRTTLHGLPASAAVLRAARRDGLRRGDRHRKAARAIAGAARRHRDDAMAFFYGHLGPHGSYALSRA